MAAINCVLFNHVFRTNWTMYFSLKLLSALEFHITACCINSLSRKTAYNYNYMSWNLFTVINSKCMINNGCNRL